MEDRDRYHLRAAVEALLARGKRRGFVTYDELHRALPQEHVTAEQIEDTMALLWEMGIHAVEGEDGDDGDDPVDVPPEGPLGPLPLQGEAEFERHDRSTEAVGGPMGGSAQAST